MEHPHKVYNSKTLIQNKVQSGRYFAQITEVADNMQGILTIVWHAHNNECRTVFITPLSPDDEAARNFLEDLGDAIHPYSKRVREHMEFELLVDVDEEAMEVHIVDLKYLPPKEFKYKT